MNSFMTVSPKSKALGGDISIATLCWLVVWLAEICSIGGQSLGL